MLTDTLFTNANIYNVFLKQWSTLDIAVLAGKVLYTGKAEKANISAKTIIDCNNKPLIPGLIDIHLHIESSFCTPTTFAAAVITHGVTTVVSEPHEIANVFGLSGIEEMIRVSKGAVIDIFYGVPSSVPSTNKKLESSGGIIGLKELEELIKNYPQIICLGEVMNYSSLISEFSKIVTGEEDCKTLKLINFMKKYAQLSAIEGHCPSVRDLELAKLLYLGIDSDHCLQDPEGMRQRFTNGMFVELQEKSVTPEIINYLQNNAVEGLYCFVTDDVPPDVLEEKGHLDYILRKAMKHGLSLEKAIIASSLAPAKRMGFRDRGIIAPGKIADFILLKDLSPEFEIQSVYKNGVLYNSKTVDKTIYKFAPKFLNSLDLPLSLLSEEMYKLKVNPEARGKTTVKCRIMQKNSKNTYTESVIRSLPVSNGAINWSNPKLDANLIIVIDRYSGEAHTAQGLMGGVRLQNGAFCTSHAHDHHNILLLGDNIKDMKAALNWVLEKGGGMCTVSSGNILASVPLPVGGIISEAPMEELSKDVQILQRELRNLGINHANPIMSLCTLTLPVSPELKITDKGLIDVRKSKIVSLFVG
ncbi:MAG: adenine deaminase [Spirochaetaceae bacterium]|nr:adenine deaminase [Spirochaetaceae bacterium]